MELRFFEKGFNFSQDGPGNRLVYHLQGCNLHCPWCSNPEGIGAFCNQTVSYSIDNIEQEILSCRSMFFGGGGVTFTGGEVTCQWKAVQVLIIRLHQKGIHIALESNASLPEFADIASHCDYLMVDFKHPDGFILKNSTGADIQQIRKNLMEIGKTMNLHIRIPLIHGFNDTDESLNGFLSFFQELQTVTLPFDVEFLPYHEYGKDKWIALGKDYAIDDGFVSKERLLQCEQALTEAGITVIHT